MIIVRIYLPYGRWAEGSSPTGDPKPNTTLKRGILSPLRYESDRVDNERILFEILVLDYCEDKIFN